MKAVRRVNLKSADDKGKYFCNYELCMMMNVNYTSYSDHFIMYTNNKLLRCTIGTNIMLQASYTSFKKIQIRQIYRDRK